MGLFDNAVPGGNISKPLLIALGALLAGKVFSDRFSNSDPEPAPRIPDNGNVPNQTSTQRAPQIPTSRPAPQPDDNDGGLLGGLGGLLDKLRNAGHTETADSWVRQGENKPIAPTDLGKALGQRTLSEVASQAGMSEDELLQQLSRVLPGVVDKLTPDGRVPSNAEVSGTLRNSPW